MVVVSRSASLSSTKDKYSIELTITIIIRLCSHFKARSVFFRFLISYVIKAYGNSLKLFLINEVCGGERAGNRRAVDGEKALFWTGKEKARVHKVKPKAAANLAHARSRVSKRAPRLKSLVVYSGNLKFCLLGYPLYSSAPKPFEVKAKTKSP